MLIWPVLICYVAVFGFFLWLLYRFINLTRNVHCLANQARKANGDELPKTNPAPPQPSWLQRSSLSLSPSSWPSSVTCQVRCYRK